MQLILNSLLMRMKLDELLYYIPELSCGLVLKSLVDGGFQKPGCS